MRIRLLQKYTDNIDYTFWTRNFIKESEENHHIWEVNYVRGQQFNVKSRINGSWDINKSYCEIYNPFIIELPEDLFVL